MKPTVSFVVPALDVEATLARTLDSILAQEYPSELIDIIVVDNGSTDRTVEIAESYPVQLASESTPGRSAPRNRGIRMTRGDFIASVDADCEVPPNFVSSLLSALDSPWIAAAHARVQKAGMSLPSSELRLVHYYMPFIDTCAMICRRQACENAQGFDNELERNVDMDFSFRLLACGYAFAWVPQTIVTKHHDLSRKQAFRRGWEGGRSSFQLNSKWRHAIRRSSTGLAIDRLKSWTLPFVRDLAALKIPSPVAVAETGGRICSYAYHRALGVPSTIGHYPWATRVPQLLGPDRFLVFGGDRCTLFDASEQMTVALNAVETRLLRALLDSPDAPRETVSRFAKESDVSESVGRDAIARLDRCIQSDLRSS